MTPPQTLRTRWKRVSLPNKLTVLCTFIIAIATVTYAFIASQTLTTMGGQLSAISESNKISRDTFDAANRPYVGVNSVIITHIGFDAKKESFTRTVRTHETIIMFVRFEFKNFGTVPALNVRNELRVFLDGVEYLGKPKIPDTPSSVFPGQTVSLGTTIGTKDYGSVTSGKRKLEIQASIYYEWPGRHQAECNKGQYDPTMNVFLNLGACTK
jgi:hypothetical protein